MTERWYVDLANYYVNSIGVIYIVYQRHLIYSNYHILLAMRTSHDDLQWAGRGGGRLMDGGGGGLLN